MYSLKIHTIVREEFIFTQTFHHAHDMTQGDINVFFLKLSLDRTQYLKYAVSSENLSH